MKFFLFLFLILNCTCFAQVNEVVDAKIKTIIGQVDLRDKECINQIAKAEHDFKTKEIYYYIIPDGYLMSNATKHHTFLSQLLKEKGIAFERVSDIGIIWQVEDKQTYPTKTTCYEEAYDRLLDVKYGQDFCKKLEKKADSLYVMSRINASFKYPDEVDCFTQLERKGCLIYPKAKEFLNQKIQIQSDFKDGFKLPKKFLLDNVQKEFIAKCNFIINRDSSVSDVNIQLEFHNPENAVFMKNFKQQIIKFINDAHWNAATAAGITVNTYVEIVLIY